MRYFTLGGRALPFAALSLALVACGSTTSNVDVPGGGQAGASGSSVGEGGISSASGGASAAGAAQGGQVASGGSQTTGLGGSAVAGSAASAGSPASTGGKGEGGASTGSGGGATASGGTTPSGGAAGSMNSGGAGAGTAGAGVVEPAPGQYGKRTNLPLANSEMAVAELDGKIYALGGYPASRTPQAAVQVYDPRTNTWDYAAELPFAVHHPVAVGVAGRVYSFGGQLASGDTNRVLAYDPALDTWSERTPMPTARGAGAGAVLGDLVYVIAGRPPSADNAFEAYSVSGNSWTTLPDLPQTFADRNHIAATAINGKIYVAGGRYDGGSFSDPRTASLDIYDPVAMRWITGAPMLRPRGGANGIAAHGCFFVWGGEGSGIGEPNDVFPDMDVYDPVNDRWTALAPLPTPIHGVTGAAFVDGLIYIPGGGTTSGGSSGSQIFQVYRPSQRCD